MRSGISFMCVKALRSSIGSSFFSSVRRKNHYADCHSRDLARFDMGLRPVVAGKQLTLHSGSRDVRQCPQKASVRLTETQEHLCIPASWVEGLVCLESQVANQNRPLYPKVAHSSLKTPRNCEPLDFQARPL